MRRHSATVAYWGGVVWEGEGEGVTGFMREIGVEESDRDATVTHYSTSYL